jgi:hypothetical protein
MGHCVSLAKYQIKPAREEAPAQKAEDMARFDGCADRPCMRNGLPTPAPAPEFQLP